MLKFARPLRLVGSGVQNLQLGVVPSLLGIHPLKILNFPRLTVGENQDDARKALSFRLLAAL